MEQEFSISKGWKIFGYVFSGAIICIMLYFLGDAITSGENIPLWIVLNIITIALFGYMIISLYKSKIVLTSDQITQYGAFSQKRLIFDQVKGIRITQKGWIVIESGYPGQPKITIGDLSYTKNSSQLTEFLTGKFKNLDDIEYNTELAEALHDPTIGTSVEDREQRLTDVKKITRILNIGGIIVTFWLFIYPNPYLLAVVAGLIYPLIALIYFFKQQEVIMLVETKKKSAYPSLTFAIIFPPMGLGIRVLIQYALLYPKDFIVPAGVLFIALGLIFLLFTRASKNKISNLLTGIVFSLMYSAGAIVMVNCAFDRSVPAEYKTKVLDQRISSGKSTTYYLTLDGWGPRKEQEDESVPHSVYNQVKKGDVVTVYVKRGYLHIPWYFVDL